MNAPGAGVAAHAQSGPPPKRKLRNYLLNPRFQLKYAGALVAVAVVLMLALGAVIYQTAKIAARQAQTAVQQTLNAATQAERAMQESATSSRIVRMNQLGEAADNPELVRTITEELERADRAAAQNLAEVRAQRHAVDAQRQDIERNRRRTIYILAIAGLTLAILLGLAGIVITHRVVGPIFKIKRLLRQVGSGQLVIRERLRKGDELNDLFETFIGMVESLRANQEREIARLDAAIVEAERTEAASHVIDKLRALRGEMAVALQDRGSVRPPA